MWSSKRLRSGSATKTPPSSSVTCRKQQFTVKGGAKRKHTVSASDRITRAKNLVRHSKLSESSAKRVRSNCALHVSDSCSVESSESDVIDDSDDDSEYSPNDTKVEHEAPEAYESTSTRWFSIEHPSFAPPCRFGGFSALDDLEGLDDVSGRWIKFSETASDIDSRIKSLLNDAAANTLSALDARLAITARVCKETSTLPVTLVIAGINRSDHKTSLARIRTHIEASSHFIVAEVKPQQCRSSNDVLASIEMSIRKRSSRADDLIQASGQFSSGGDREFRQGILRPRTQAKAFLQFDRLREDVSLLETKQSTSVGDISRLILSESANVRSMDAKDYGLCVIIHDGELLSCDVLDATLYALWSISRVGISVCVLIGVASSSNSLQTQLSARTAERLSFGSAHLASPLSQIEVLVKEMVLGAKFSLQLSPQLVDSLWRHFEQCDMSLSSFCAGARLALLSHFDTVPFSDKWFISEESIEDAELMLFSLPSIKRAWKDRQRAENFTGRVSFLRDCYKRARTYRASLDMAVSTIQRLSKAAIGESSSWRAIYGTLLGTGKKRDEFLRRVTRMICGVGTIYDLQGRIDSMVQALTASSDGIHSFEKEIERLKSYRHDASQLNNNSAPLEQQRTESAKSMNMRRQQLAALGGRQSGDRLKASAEKVAQTFTGICDELLPSFECIPLHELFLVDGSDLLESTRALELERIVHSAITSKEIGSNLDDIRVAYQHFLEGGSRLHLYAWLEHFLAQRDLPENSESTSRFVQSISEMRWLGFITNASARNGCVARAFYERSSV